MTPLTKRQKQIYLFIRDHFTESQISPTYVEIARTFNIGHGSARQLVHQLEKRGWVRILPRAHRAIELLDTRLL